MEEYGDKQEKFKKTTEKLWDSTRKKLYAATFQANKYKRVVQKKIDLGALHKKISATHNELGKLIDDIREGEPTDILATNEVQELFHKLDTLKLEAASLEKEIEDIKAEAQMEEEEEKKSAETDERNGPVE